ncbi:MAG: hypothetical protein QM790_16415 [Nibricoccus sp.]
MMNWTPLVIIVGAAGFFAFESFWGAPVWNFLSGISPLGYLMRGVDTLVGSRGWEALIQAVFHPKPHNMIGMSLAWSMSCAADIGGAFLIPYTLAGFFAHERRILVLAAASALIATYFIWVSSSHTYWLLTFLGIAFVMPFLLLCFMGGMRLGQICRKKKC